MEWTDPTESLITCSLLEICFLPILWNRSNSRKRASKASNGKVMPGLTGDRHTAYVNFVPRTTYWFNGWRTYLPTSFVFWLHRISFIFVFCWFPFSLYTSLTYNNAFIQGTAQVSRHWEWECTELFVSQWHRLCCFHCWEVLHHRLKIRPCR